MLRRIGKAMLCVFATACIFSNPAKAQDHNTLQAYGLTISSREKALNLLIDMRTMSLSPAFAGLDGPQLGPEAMLNICEGSDSERKTCIGMMHMAVYQVIDMSRVGRWNDFCSPKLPSDEDLRNIVIKFIRTNPQAVSLRLAPTDAAVMSILEISACAK